MYKVIESEHIAGVDIDETLISCIKTDDANTDSLPYYIEYPYGILGVVKVYPNRANINLVKLCHSKGYKMVAWSQAGYKWAEAVIKTLELEKYFEVIMTKPSRYIDDKPVTDWMTERIWLKPNTPGWDI
jgi:beta-phosphoglucomutase-like phosphatase (HAD superfamily)